MDDAEQREMVAQRVRRILADKLRRPAAEIDLNAALVQDLNFDSLEIVELVFALEKEFGLEEIPDDEAEKLRTVMDIVEYIQGALA